MKIGEAKDYRTHTLRHYPQLRMLLLETGARGRLAEGIHSLGSSRATTAPAPSTSKEVISLDEGDDVRTRRWIALRKQRQ